MILKNLFLKFNKYLPKSILENYVLIEKINLKFYKKFKSENYFIPQFEVSDQLKFFYQIKKALKRSFINMEDLMGLLNFIIEN